MVVVGTFKCLWTPISSDGVVGSTTQLANVTKLSITFKLGKAADGFTVNVFDKSLTYFNQISEGDILEIYGSVDGGTNYTIIIDGRIGSTKLKRSVDNTELTITGLNRLEALLGVITFVVGKTGQMQTADAWIRQIIREVNTINGYAEYTNAEEPELKGGSPLVPEKYIKGGTLTEWREVGNDETTKTFGAEFQKGDEPAFELIENLSGKTYAEIMHTFYLDTNNYFRWDSVATTATDSFNSNFIDQTITHKQYDKYNYVIVKAGTNLYDSANINSFQYDLIAATQNGIKATVLYQNGIAEQAKHELLIAENNQAKYDEEKFPFPSSYPITLPKNWKYSGATSASDDVSLNSAFVNQVSGVADDYANDFIDNRAKAEYKTTQTILSTESFLAGVLLGDFKTLPLLSSVSKGQRIETKKLIFTPMKGWGVSLGLKEDVDKVEL